MSIPSLKAVCIAVLCIHFCIPSLAHNGSVAFAYPLGKITVDGDFSDWPKDAAKYMVAMNLSETKPKDDADFSGFFQLGYRLEDQSLYVAFTIRDDDFVEDTSENVRWNTQDGLQVSIDARHLMSGSGVASFMYSKKLRNINNAFYDPFASTASWKIAEVAMVRKGDMRYYEWRIQLGNELTVGKSVGFDFNVMDMDKDGSFSWTDWGKGYDKYMNPNSLGDIIFLPNGAKLSTVSGKVSWDQHTAVKLPGQVRLKSLENPKLWTSAEVDSVGNYSIVIPAGKYELSFPSHYYQSDDKLYSVVAKEPLIVVAKPGQKVIAPDFVLPLSPVPDLIPDKGVLFDFTADNPGKVDSFIEAYREYYGIPGVSLALIKDGKVVYHKTYGVTNTMTGQKVSDSTLFEAASVTKPVFALAVERLAERGVIDLDKPLYQYLPYKDIEYDDRYKLITARHVLTHRTGFPNWRDGKLSIKFTPGTAFGYSGEGFEYLKMVVEKITGKSVEQVLQEEVIQPVGLYHTFFSKNDSLQRVVAYGHFDGRPSNNDLPEKPGMAYSMHTEALIFTRFMLFLLEQKGLKPETYNTIMSKQSEYDFSGWTHKPKVPTYMGMSLEIRETPFGKTFGHGGNNGDFKCRFEVYKDLKMGYAIFTNSNTSDALLQNFHSFLIEGRDKDIAKQ
ncbi:serine hydrolase [Chitinophaga filiformis]|uniref:CubicO group peptidase, beta-lactamase class C family n=1 Tax=Chitinophaga filiformis TaxID=104663 RepID=A0A1G7M9L6_CHIFI|nr:serine hydrolase [Chitinophaga filiformis]SDF58425.1 CubicO group peptidase, beta-lactamase class C family [Chitinophaga filiformis]